MDTKSRTDFRHNSYSGSSEINSSLENADSDDSYTQTSEEEIEGDRFSFSRLPRKKKCLILSFCATSSLLMMSESIMSPLYPEETDERGISTALSGWVFASYALGQVILAPIIGKLLPYIGSRFIYLSGVFFAGGCTILFGALAFIPVKDGQTLFIVFCFIMQIVLSVGVTAQQTATFSMASKEFGSFFTTVFGLTEVFVGLGMTVGPAIGGVLYSMGGFYLPFTVVGSLIIGTLPVSFFLIPKVRASSSLVPTNDIRQEYTRKTPTTRIILKDPTAIVTLLAVMIGAGMWAVLDPILEPRLTEYGLTPELSGIMFLLLSASYALSAPISGWVADKLSDNRLLIIPALLVCALSHFLLGGSELLGFDPEYREVWIEVLALIILGISLGMAIIPSYQIILDCATNAGLEDNMVTNGAVAGLWCSMYALGDFIGPVYGGWMVEIEGFSWTLTYTGCFSIFVAMLLSISAVYDKKCRRRWKGSIEEEQTKLLEEDFSECVLFTDVYMKTILVPYQMA